MMKTLLRTLILGGLFWTLGSGLYAQTAETPKTSNDYYQSALQAYLTGDFDEAILWDTKALQLDPQDKKAESLLSILVSEKDTDNKTVIWIGGKPTVVQEVNPNPAPVAAPVTIIKEKAARPAAADNRKLQELETRVQTVAFIMERDSFNQYRELSGAQAQTNKNIQELSLNVKGLGFGMWLLFILALALSSLSLWKSWRNGLAIKQQTAGFQPSDAEEKGRVLKIHRM